MKRRPLWLSGLLALTMLANACAGRSEPYTSLTSENPVAQNSAGLTVSASPTSLTEKFGVQINALTAENLSEAEAWQTALQALPANLTLQNNLFEIKTNGEAPEQVFLSLIIPAGQDTLNLDAYAWDGTRWTFLPAHARGNQLVAAVTTLPQAVGLFGAAPTPPLAWVLVQPGQALDEATANAANAVLLEGVTVANNGTLSGQLPAVATDRVYAVYPVVSNHDAALNLSLFTQPEVRATHQQQLAAFAANADYDGLVLDYGSLSVDLKADFTTFVTDLAVLLHAQQKALLIRMDGPLPTPLSGAQAATSGFDTAGYDWRGLSAAADALILSVGDSPVTYGDGSAESLLAWATGEVSRSQLRLLTSALSVERTGDALTLKDYETALAPLGSAILADAVDPRVAPLAPQAGQSITVTLSGQAQTLGYDPLAYAAWYEYADAAGAKHSVWLVSAETVRQRLTLAEKYHLGGVALSDIPASGIAAEVAQAVTNYKVNVAASVPSDVALLWTVNSNGAVVAQATAQPGQDYVYVAQAPGEYQFSAELQNGSTVSLGSVGVNVSDAVTVAITSTPGVSGTTGGTSGGGDTSGGDDTSGGGGGDDSGGDGFIPPPPVSTGSFELGGQVPGFIGHPVEMQQSGMKWVKFQAVGDTGGMIAAGHAAGFNVLISALGDKSRAADPSYWPEYASWVAGIAAQGANAIEIWNEANLDREWPNGQINGATYTGLLRAAYDAIKGVNSSTIVIGGAPAPTGAAGGAGCIAALCNDDVFLEQMANAGAASYMDCVGVHFNSGTTSPNDTSGSALSGYHYSYYFWPMIDLYYDAFGGSRQLCFTELGYVTPEGYDSVPLPSYFQWAAGNTLAEQAQWLAESASLAASSGKVRLMIIFNVDFTQYLANDPQAGYAMLRPNGTCPACAALDTVMP